METWKMGDFLQKLKKVVRIVLYGPAIGQSDCRKAGPYQLPFNNRSKTISVISEIRHHEIFICAVYQLATRLLESKWQLVHKISG